MNSNATDGLCEPEGDISTDPPAASCDQCDFIFHSMCFPIIHLGINLSQFHLLIFGIIMRKEHWKMNEELTSHSKQDIKSPYTNLKFPV